MAVVEWKITQNSTASENLSVPNSTMPGGNLSRKRPRHRRDSMVDEYRR